MNQPATEISPPDNSITLTDRQKRELEYHDEEHAELARAALEADFSYEVVEPGPRRWWNQYWSMMTYLLGKDLKGKRVLIVGCGFGEDALHLAQTGAEVHAFDLSPDSIRVANDLAVRENQSVDYRVMTAETLEYENDFFDIVVARDILHHVEIPECLSEISRVAKKDGIFIANEIYSHSVTERIRYSRVVDKWLYKKMVSFVYGEKTYITEDEEKLSEKEVSLVKDMLDDIELHSYFNMLVHRILPDRYPFASKVDRALLKLLSPIAPFLGSRVLIAGKISN